MREAKLAHVDLCRRAFAAGLHAARMVRNRLMNINRFDLTFHRSVLDAPGGARLILGQFPDTFG
jgi:hypothetical protein